MSKAKQMTMTSITARVGAMPESLTFSEGFSGIYAHPTRLDEIVFRPTSKMTAKRVAAWLVGVGCVEELTMRNGYYSRVRPNSPIWIATVDDECEPLTVERFDTMWKDRKSDSVIRKEVD